ncbi:hypothetical protein CBD41_01985 [bacterium TMED181]|nr:hypothetical protein [Planctomycetota bacterium]OUW46860.1 MAG: hypothetical protein CBD41_01985 [bacterium TMED181]
MTNLSEMYLTSNEALIDIMSRARDMGRYGIDLEFIREKSYFPKLALVQISVGEELRLIDPLSDISLDPILETVSDPDIVKIVHAGGQDMEILELESGQTPANVFDTQIAAAFLGLGLQPAYSVTCERILGKFVQKGESWTNWLKRPLTENQETYALDDVRHLIPLHDSLTESLGKEGRLSWALAEMDKYSRKETYHPLLETSLKKVKKSGSLDSRGVLQLGYLYEWREAEARRQDRPRRRILPDEILVELARRAPSNSESLRSLRGLDSRDARRFGDEILKAIARGKSVPQHEIPEIQRRRRLEPEEEAALELATSALRALCRAARIAPPLVGNNGDVEDLIRAKAEKDPNLSNLKLASGWRGELFGDKIISFLTGRSVLRMDPQSGYPSLEDL